MSIEAQLLAVREALAFDREVPLPEGGTVLYVFGGEPNDKGTHPRHVGIVAEDGEPRLSVFMRDFERPQRDKYFDVVDVGAALAKIADFFDDRLSDEDSESHRVGHGTGSMPSDKK